MSKAFITGTGLFTPPNKISNDELVNSFNKYVDKFNAEHKTEIDNGIIEAMQYSNSEFIEKASGIKSRYVMEKTGILDINLMRPKNLERPNEQPNILCEMAINAAKEAMENANISSNDIDAVIVGCSNMPRPYPALSVEIQNELNISGFGFDLNVACASAVFAIQAATDSIKQNHANTVLIVNPEICSAHLNFTDRDSHFIFGDAATAIIIQNEKSVKNNLQNSYEILDTKLVTQFSNNIRNNFGFLNNTNPEDKNNKDKLFIQNGRSVFKEVIPIVANTITEHLKQNDINPELLKRIWLHQANLNMNQLIAKKVFGKDLDLNQAPVVLDQYANTSSAGSIIAFHKHNVDLAPKDIGIISAFGAGYSCGSAIIKKC